MVLIHKYTKSRGSISAWVIGLYSVVFVFFLMVDNFDMLSPVDSFRSRIWKLWRFRTNNGFYFDYITLEKRVTFFLNVYLVKYLIK